MRSAANKRFYNRKKIIESSEIDALAVPADAEELPPPGSPILLRLPEEQEELNIAQIIEKLSSEELKRLISINTLAVFLKHPMIAYNNYLQEIGKNKELEKKIELIKVEGKSNAEIMNEIIQMEYKDKNL